ncbi:hypothetical protein [Embleya scabrispora]|uniref:hypothetical protein n=1 Tax=Embleya scabrispora TaxID=159449 RepID=UPI00037B7DDE|nr:hypothetical protein [Embleya scabrispora]MYS81611.1 hypothetical protein [Streptomyces sp. SID5474]
MAAILRFSSRRNLVEIARFVEVRVIEPQSRNWNERSRGRPYGSAAGSSALACGESGRGRMARPRPGARRGHHLPAATA